MNCINNSSSSLTTLHANFVEEDMKNDLFLEDSILNLTKVILEAIFLDVFKDQNNEKSLYIQ